MAYVPGIGFYADGLSERIDADRLARPLIVDVAIDVNALAEMAQFLADMYSKRVSLVVVGLEDVPASYRRTVEKILGQLIHNAIRHGVEIPADRVSSEAQKVTTEFSRHAKLPGFRPGKIPANVIRSRCGLAAMSSAAISRLVRPSAMRNRIFRCCGVRSGASTPT